MDGREGGPGPAGSVSAACLGRGDGVRTGMGGILSSCTLVVAAHNVNLCVFLWLTRSFISSILIF